MKSTPFLTGALVALWIGCGCRKADQSVVTPPEIPTTKPIETASPRTNRIIVERISTLYDDVAYNDIRGIYVIKDLQTGKEYLGISGIGISELGSHGKAQRDER